MAEERAVARTHHLAFDKRPSANMQTIERVLLSHGWSPTHIEWASKAREWIVVVRCPECGRMGFFSAADMKGVLANIDQVKICSSCGLKQQERKVALV